MTTYPTLTRKQATAIQQLQRKRHRTQRRCFIVAGAKSVMTFLTAGHAPQCLVATPVWIEQNPAVAHRYANLLYRAPPTQVAALSGLKTNTALLMIARKHPATVPPLPSDQRLLILDTLRNPGNVGTILRIADWYHIPDVVAAPTTVDYYHPQVVQASMGSLARVRVHHTTLTAYLQTLCNQHIPIIGAVLNGHHLHQHPLPKHGALLIGNEANGIQQQLLPYITHPVTIPRYGHAESLNAAIAAAIICDRWCGSF